MTASPSPAIVGQPVTFTATVTGFSPTGTVQFKDGAANLGAPVTLIEGVATLTTTALSAASHAISAVYSGDANNLASTSTIKKAPVFTEAQGCIFQEEEKDTEGDTET